MRTYDLEVTQASGDHRIYVFDADTHVTVVNDGVAVLTFRGPHIPDGHGALSRRPVIREHVVGRGASFSLSWVEK